jgi:hypothetical protein
MILTGLLIVGLTFVATHLRITPSGPLVAFSFTLPYGNSKLEILLILLLPLFAWGYSIAINASAIRREIILLLSLFVIVVTTWNLAVAPPRPAWTPSGNEEFNTPWPADDVSFCLGFGLGFVGLAFAVREFLREKRQS